MFITFEGLDFCGKSTQAALLAKTLEQRGRNVIMLRDPGGTPISEKVRAILLDPKNKEMSMKAELFLFSAARTQMVSEIIRPALNEGKVVICDRFYDSTSAYQGYGRNLDVAEIEILNRIASNGTTPEVTLFIDVATDALIERQRSSGSSADRMESSGRAFFERVRGGYLSLVEKYPHRMILINGEPPVEMVQDQIWKVVSQRLTLRGINA